MPASTRPIAAFCSLALLAGVAVALIPRPDGPSLQGPQAKPTNTAEAIQSAASTAGAESATRAALSASQRPTPAAPAKARSATSSRVTTSATRSGVADAEAAPGTARSADPNAHGGHARVRGSSAAAAPGEPRRTWAELVQDQAPAPPSSGPGRFELGRRRREAARVAKAPASLEAEERGAVTEEAPGRPGPEIAQPLSPELQALDWIIRLPRGYGDKGGLAHAELRLRVQHPPGPDNLKLQLVHHASLRPIAIVESEACRRLGKTCQLRSLGPGLVELMVSGGTLPLNGGLLFKVRFEVDQNAPTRSPVFVKSAYVLGLSHPRLGLVGDIMRLE